MLNPPLLPIDLYQRGKRTHAFRWPAAPRAGDRLDLDGKFFDVESITWEVRTGSVPPVWVRVNVVAVKTNTPRRRASHAG